MDDLNSHQIIRFTYDTVYDLICTTCSPMKKGAVTTLAERDLIRSLLEANNNDSEDDELFHAESAQPAPTVIGTKSTAAQQGVKDDDFSSHWIFLEQLSVMEKESDAMEIFDCYGSSLFISNGKTLQIARSETKLDSLFLACFDGDVEECSHAMVMFKSLVEVRGWVCRLKNLLRVLQIFGAAKELVTPCEQLLEPIANENLKQERPPLYICNDAVRFMGFLLEIVRISYEGASIE